MNPKSFPKREPKVKKVQPLAAVKKMWVKYHKRLKPPTDKEVRAVAKKLLDSTPHTYTDINEAFGDREFLHEIISIITENRYAAKRKALDVGSDLL